MLLAEELALVALKPESGRHQIGTGDALNACLAGLLVADLLLGVRSSIVRLGTQSSIGSGPRREATARSTPAPRWSSP